MSFLISLKRDRFNAIDFVSAVVAAATYPHSPAMASVIWLAVSLPLNIIVALITRTKSGA